MTGRSVLVVGGRLPALTAARALAADGYRVIAGDGGEYSTVWHSRDCHERWRHPPIRDGESFTAAVAAFLAARPEITIVLPVGERYVASMAASRDRIPAVTIAAPAEHHVKTCTDKATMYAIAAETGVPHATTRGARDLPSLAAAAEDVGYPCIVKPASWAVPMPEGRKAIICPDRATFERELVDWPSGHALLLVQRFVAGARHNLHLVARGGRILASMQTRSIRTDRADGTGVGVEAVSVSRDPRLLGHTGSLLARIGYTGVGLAQFIIGDQDEPMFLEFKPFLGSGYAFAEALGLRQTRASIELADGRGPTWRGSGFHYSLGRRYAWTSRDLYGIGMAISRREVGAVKAAGWLASALRSAARANVHATWSWRDPLPTLALYADLGKRLARTSRRGRG